MLHECPQQPTTGFFIYKRRNWKNDEEIEKEGEEREHLKTEIKGIDLWNQIVSNISLSVPPVRVRTENKI